MEKEVIASELRATFTRVRNKDKKRAQAAARREAQRIDLESRRASGGRVDLWKYHPLVCVVATILTFSLFVQEHIPTPPRRGRKKKVPGEYSPRKEKNKQKKKEADDNSNNKEESSKKKQDSSGSESAEDGNIDDAFDRTFDRMIEEAVEGEQDMLSDTVKDRL